MMNDIELKELEEKIISNVRKLKKAEAEGSYAGGSISEEAIIRDLYWYAINKYTEPGHEDGFGNMHAEIEEYSVEIVSVSKACIRCYSEGDGNFIHYFNRSISQRIRVSTGKEITSRMSGGMSIPKQKAIDMSRARRILENEIKNKEDDEEMSLSEDIDPDDMMDLLLKLHSEEKIQTLPSMEEVKAYLNMKSASLYKPIDDDESGMTFADIIPSNYENEYLAVEGNNADFFEIVEKEFQNTQDRTRECLRDVLTVFILKMDSDGSLGRDMNDGNYPWFNHDMYKEFLATRKLPLQKQIAEKHGRSPSSLSTTFTTFWGRVARRMEGVKGPCSYI